MLGPSRREREREMLRRFSHWPLCFHFLSLSTSPNYYGKVGSDCTRPPPPPRSPSAQLSARAAVRNRALSAPSADGHAHNYCQCLAKRPCHCASVDMHMVVQHARLPAAACHACRECEVLREVCRDVPIFSCFRKPFKRFLW